MASLIYPEWTGADSAAKDWDTVYLGGVIIPGTVRIDGLECGIDRDTKKAKGSDKPTSTDNGVKPAKFEIDVWLNSKQWVEWQSVVDAFNPRRPGRERAPLQIKHPVVNHIGIENVAVISLAPQHPTARGGMHIKIRVEEWFDKPVAVKKPTATKPIPAQNNAAYNAANLDQMRVDALNRNRADALKQMSEDGIDPNNQKPLSPSDTSNLERGMFPALGT